MSADVCFPDIKQGEFYIVATPIGNFADITIRALDVLRSVAIIAAEDTRHSSNLLNHYGIKSKLISLHNFNEEKKSSFLLDFIKQGKNIALISDAGTPLISDPGYRIVVLAKSFGIKVIPIPGPCAAIAAISVSGLPSDKFIFEGFLPSRETQKNSRLSELKFETRTVIYYEAPHRILDTINSMEKIFGPNRFVVVARELTKKFETVISDELFNIKLILNKDKSQQKGEFVILVKGYDYEKNISYDNAYKILEILSEELPPKKAANLTSKITGFDKRKLYTALISKAVVE